MLPRSPLHSRSSSTASSVESAPSASDHCSRISATSSFDTLRTSISGSSPSETAAATAPPPLDKAHLEKLAYEGSASPFIEMEEIMAPGYHETRYTVAANQVVTLYSSCQSLRVRTQIWLPGSLHSPHCSLQHPPRTFHRSTHPCSLQTSCGRGATSGPQAAQAR